MKLTFRQYSEYKNRVKMYEAFVTEFEHQEALEDAINEELTTEQKYQVDKTVSKIPNRDEKIKKFWSKQKLDGSYDDNFKNGRMTIPVEFDSNVKSFIESKGYTIKDHINGIASKKEKVGDPSRGIPNKEVEREYKIGKVLQKEGAHPDIIKAYENDKTKESLKDGKYDLVITHHPHDVAGKSTDRGWSSCMDLSDGSHKNKIDDDLKQMTHEAYLVRSGEDVDKNPIARMSLKLHRSLNSTHSVLIPEDRSHGNAPEGFKEKVKDIVSKISPLKDNNIYQKHPDLYNDDSKPIKNNIKGEVSSKVLDSLFDNNIKNGKINSSNHFVVDYLNFVKPEHKYKNQNLQNYQKLKVDAEDPEKFKGDFVDTYNHHKTNFDNVSHLAGLMVPYIGTRTLHKTLAKKIADKFDVNNPKHREFDKTNIDNYVTPDIETEIQKKIRTNPKARNVDALRFATQRRSIWSDLFDPDANGLRDLIDKKNWEGSGDPSVDYFKKHSQYNHGEGPTIAASIMLASKGSKDVPENHYEHLDKIPENIGVSGDYKNRIAREMYYKNSTLKADRIKSSLGNNRVAYSISKNHEANLIPQAFKNNIDVDTPGDYSRSKYPVEHKLLDEFDRIRNKG